MIIEKPVTIKAMFTSEEMIKINEVIGLLQMLEVHMEKEDCDQCVCWINDDSDFERVIEYKDIENVIDKLRDLSSLQEIC